MGGRSADQWAVKPGAFVPVVDQQTFDRVQMLLQKRQRRTSDEELLKGLRRLLKRRGKLTQNLIEEAPNLPSICTYYHHLGSLRRVYEVLGYHPDKGTFVRSDSRMHTMRLRAELVSRIAAMFGHSMTIFQLPGRMRSIIRFDDSVCVSVILCPTCRTPSGRLRWKLNPIPEEGKFVTLLCRLNAKNDDFKSFLMFPGINRLKPCRLKENSAWFSTAVPLNDLSQLHEIAKQLHP